MVYTKWGRRAIFPCATLLLIIMVAGLAPSSEAAGDGWATIRGSVIDFQSREPIANATVAVWEKSVLIARQSTDAFGLFAVQVPRDHSYRVYIYADISSTPGWDYLPAFKGPLTPTGDVSFTAELRPGASVIIDKDIQFVDTTSSSTTYTYEVSDPESGVPLDIEGYKPIYGTIEGTHTYFLGLNTSYLVVPAEIPFTIKVNASAIVGGKVITRFFNIDEPEHLRLSKGDLAHLDVRKYTLQYNLAMVKGQMSEIEEKIDEMDGLGFYLFLEKQRFTTTAGAVDRAEFDLSQRTYTDSFTELRRAYIDATDLYNGLNGMYSDAATSVYVLIFFLAFTSTTVSFLMFEKILYKVAASGILTALTHIVLHEIYPAVSYIPNATFIEFSAVALGVAFLATIVFPHFLKGRAVEGKTPLRNILVPIFSLAKRSLTRRRLRFVLTLSSVMILVMSFVVLTSFNMGYGLILNRISKQQLPVNGVLVRAPSSGYSAGDFSFTPLDATAIDWFKKQGEVETVAPRAENQPLLIPAATLSGAPIYGFIGIQPSAEAKILGIERVLVEGRYLQDGEEDTILISSDLKQKLGVEVNATLSLGTRTVKVVGIYSYEELKWLNDLDGTSIIPNKLVNLAQPSEPARIEAIPVESEELVICDLETALKMPGVFLSRIDAVLRERASVNDFAERVALERNYNVWASSSDGLYIAMLGTYFQGKGIPLAVPWAIVVLNVVITMLNALYERRKEISILSSVGLNPAHISGIFVAEAVAIGLIGGGMGYLLGLSTYRAMAFLHITLEVRQKVSALWCIGALTIAMTAVVMGALSALRGSVIITPSLRRRWSVEEEKERGNTVEMSLPIKVPKGEIEEFMNYVLKILRGYENDPLYRTERIRVRSEDIEERSARTIIFIYRMTGGAFASFSHNTLMVERGGGEESYTVKMVSSGDRAGLNQVGSLVRMIIMRWSTRK
jgi:ABC-type lipoprotein release transport system permease subunit